MDVKRILVADDHFATRIGIKYFLKNEFSNVEFGEVTNGRDLFQKIDSEKWDLIILDIHIPGNGGIEVLKRLRTEKPGVPVLVFSVHAGDPGALRALKAGASGFLSKDAADIELAKAVRELFAGRRYITPSVAELMASQLENPRQAPHELLSDREYQTLLLIASGKTVSQIAVELSLGVSTVSTYRVRILEKMGLKNNAELTHYVIEHGLS